MFFSNKQAFAKNRNCSVSIEPVQFGSYNIFEATPLDAIGTIELFCTSISIPGETTTTGFDFADTGNVRDDLSFDDDRFSVNPHFSITLDIAQVSKNYSDNRTLKLGDHQLQYNLFLDLAHTLIWGDGTKNTYFHQGKLANDEEQRIITLYGRIPAKQIVPPGNYTDSIRINLEW